MIRRLETDWEIVAAYPVMKQLRPRWDEETYLHIVRELYQNQRYKLAAIFEEEEVVAAAGYRIGESLAWGTYLYVDDFVTREDVRSQGHGKQLFEWLKNEARQHQCEQLHLDSGVQRHDAHRFYLRERMAIASHHFSQKL